MKTLLMTATLAFALSSTLAACAQGGKHEETADKTAAAGDKAARSPMSTSDCDAIIAAFVHEVDVTS